MNRRDFLARAALAGGVATAIAPRSRAQGDVNSEIRVALVGCGDRGGQLLQDLAKAPGAKLVAACDADLARARALAARNGNVPVDQDFRKTLERADVDAVIVATPNHLHSLVAIQACLAGKDVYCEKPVSHSIHEGRVLADVAGRTKRIVQAGLQNRSDKGIDPARDFFKAGSLGKLLAVHAFWYRVRKPIGKLKAPGEIPATVDYDLYCGPRPTAPLRRTNLHYDWHWTWDFGNGEFGNTVVHQVDHTRHLLGITEHATAVRSVGGRLAWDDDGETPNTLLVAFEYPGFEKIPYTIEIRDLAHSPERADMVSRFMKKSAGTFLLCEGGHVFFERGGGYAADRDGKQIERFPGDGGGTHMANFIAAVRSRDAASLRCPIEQGHISSCACHQANASYLCGESGHSPESVEKAAPAEFLRASEAWGGFKEHLGLNQIDFARYPLVLGPRLEFDPKTEHYTGGGPEARNANFLVADAYRAPFTLPA
jgi:predicted dehydrogenase